MREMIMRIRDDSPEVEIAVRDNKQNINFKKMALSAVTKMINDTSSHFQKKDIMLLDPEIIGISEGYVLIKQPERIRVVTTNINEEKKIKAYKINFPNSLYIVKHHSNRIDNIECYAYKNFENGDTELFAYPMPNELTGNKLCIGSAPREIVDNDFVTALEKIIFTPFSHAKFSGINGFSKTDVYFQYLSKNKFPYKLLKPLNKKLKDILRD